MGQDRVAIDPAGDAEKAPLIVDRQSDGRPLVDVVSAMLFESVPAAQFLIERGSVWADGQRVRSPVWPVREGMQLIIQRPPSGTFPEVHVAAGQILYEDADLIVLDKPAGIYVSPTPWDCEGNLEAALGRFLAARDGIRPPLHLAHRLDRDTSGVLLFSKCPEANAGLQAAFGGREVHKDYLCLCAGRPSTDEFEVATGHGRSRHGRFRVYPLEEVGRVLPGGSRVKRMQTRFKIVRQLSDAVLLRAQPITGRTHQIRLHASYLGYPLLGDRKYGGPVHWHGRDLPYHLLHAERLTLPHPRNGLLLEIVSPCPDWAGWSTNG